MKNTTNFKRDFKSTTSLLLQFFVGAILLAKAADSIVPIFPLSGYSSEAQTLMSSLESLPILSGMIIGLHVVFGAFLIFNIFVPLSLMATLPMLAHACAFEFAHGTFLLPQVLTLLGLTGSAFLVFYHKKFFTYFLKTQAYADITATDSSKTEVLILDELKEKSPEEYQKVISMKVVKETVL